MLKKTRSGRDPPSARLALICTTTRLVASGSIAMSDGPPARGRRGGDRGLHRRDGAVRDGLHHNEGTQKGVHEPVSIAPLGPILSSIGPRDASVSLPR